MPDEAPFPAEFRAFPLQERFWGTVPTSRCQVPRQLTEKLVASIQAPQKNRNLSQPQESRAEAVDCTASETADQQRKRSTSTAGRPVLVSARSDRQSDTDHWLEPLVYCLYCETGDPSLLQEKAFH